jgi:hypothetical protein
MFYEIVTSTLWTVVANLCNTEIKREKWFILFQLLLLDGHIEMLNVNLFQELFIRIKISSQQLVCWIHTTANFEQNTDTNFGQTFIITNFETLNTKNLRRKFKLWNCQQYLKRKVQMKCSWKNRYINTVIKRLG